MPRARDMENFMQLTRKRIRLLWLCDVVYCTPLYSQECDAPIGMNLGVLNGALVDVFKTSREFWEADPANSIGDTGNPLVKDADGYPLSLRPGFAARTLLLEALGGNYPTGQYTLLYDGIGRIRSGMDAVNPVYSDNAWWPGQSGQYSCARQQAAANGWPGYWEQIGKWTAQRSVEMFETWHEVFGNEKQEPVPGSSGDRAATEGSAGAIPAARLQPAVGAGREKFGATLFCGDNFLTGSTIDRIEMSFISP